MIWSCRSCLKHGHWAVVHLNFYSESLVPTADPKFRKRRIMFKKVWSVKTTKTTISSCNWNLKMDSTDIHWHIDLSLSPGPTWRKLRGKGRPPKVWWAKVQPKAKERSMGVPQNHGFLDKATPRKGWNMLETLEMVELDFTGCFIGWLLMEFMASGFYLQICVTCFCKSIMPLWHFVGYLSLLPFLLFQSRLLFLGEIIEIPAPNFTGSICNTKYHVSCLSSSLP